MIPLANALRRAHALANGLDVRALLTWHQLKQSEQNQWLNLAAAATHFGIDVDKEMAA